MYLKDSHNLHSHQSDCEPRNIFWRKFSSWIWITWRQLHLKQKLSWTWLQQRRGYTRNFWKRFNSIAKYVIWKCWRYYYLLQIVTTAKATMMNFTNLNQSPQLLRWIRFHCQTTLWMVQSNQSWKLIIQENLETKMLPEILIQSRTMTIPA